jgi:hypothetical protein
MQELDNNVFIKSWSFKEDSFVEGHLMHFYIIYIDDTRYYMNIHKEASIDDAKKILLDRIDRDLIEKGWVKPKKIHLTIESMTSNEIINSFSEIDNQEPKYNPANDPYYQNEDLYIPNEINCGS